MSILVQIMTWHRRAQAINRTNCDPVHSTEPFRVNDISQISLATYISVYRLVISVAVTGALIWPTPAGFNGSILHTAQIPMIDGWHQAAQQWTEQNVTVNVNFFNRRRRYYCYYHYCYCYYHYYYHYYHFIIIIIFIIVIVVFVIIDIVVIIIIICFRWKYRYTSKKHPSLLVLPTAIFWVILWYFTLLAMVTPVVSNKQLEL